MLEDGFHSGVEPRWRTHAEKRRKKQGTEALHYSPYGERVRRSVILCPRKMAGSVPPGIDVLSLFPPYVLAPFRYQIYFIGEFVLPSNIMRRWYAVVPFNSPRLLRENAFGGGVFHFYLFLFYFFHLGVKFPFSIFFDFVFDFSFSLRCLSVRIYFSIFFYVLNSLCLFLFFFRFSLLLCFASSFFLFYFFLFVLFLLSPFSHFLSFQNWREDYGKPSRLSFSLWRWRTMPIKSFLRHNVSH